MDRTYLQINAVNVISIGIMASVFMLIIGMTTAAIKSYQA